MYAALIIDADADAQFAIQQAFCDDPIEFRCSSSAPEGIEQAASTKTDLVLIRIELPTSSGFSVFSKLRRNSATKEIPVVLYASDVADDVFTRHASLRTHAEGYLRLPIQRQELHALIRPLLALPDPEPVAPSQQLEVELQQGPWDNDLAGQELDSALDQLDPYDPEPDEAPATPSPISADQDAELAVSLQNAQEAIQMATHDDPFDFAPLDDVALSPDSPPESPQPPTLQPTLTEGSQARKLAPQPLTEEQDQAPDPSAANRPAPTLAPVALPSEPPARHAPDGALSERRELLVLKNQLLSKDRELIALREELGRHEQEALGRRKELRTQQSKMAELQANLLAGEESHLAAQEQSQALARDLASHRIRSDQLDTELAQLKKTHASSAERETQLGEERDQLRDELQRTQEELAQASQARDLAQTKVQELEEKSQNLVAALAELKSSLQERDTTLRIRHEQVSAAKSVLTELLTRLEVS